MDNDISDIHLNEISHSHCRKWRLLYSHLLLDKIVVDDVDRMPVTEEEDKRASFFHKWKEIKGSEATYQVLYNALIKIECKSDAEFVRNLVIPSTGIGLAGNSK